MSTDRTDHAVRDAASGEEAPRAAAPLGADEPAWRDDGDPNRTLPPVAAPRDDPADAADDERTIDADPAWLAELLGGEATEDDAERTIDADVDVVEHVRAAAREARERLAAPPATAPSADPEPPPSHAEVTGPAVKGIDPLLPPPPAGVGTALPAPRPAATFEPPAAAAAPVSATPVDDGRWRPPARLRPAPTRADAPLLPTATATRRLDWRWALVGGLVAAAVGFLIALAIVGGGDDDQPDPPPGATTAPGAATTTSSP